jgi:hypothetical protein
LDQLLDVGAQCWWRICRGGWLRDGRLVDLLARTSHLVECRGGRLQLVGMGCRGLHAVVAKH